jgi:fumarate reductase (CoM/CoB) subunit A
MEETINIIDSDILIIGTGIAGLSAALKASGAGKRVVVVSKAAVGKVTNTILGGGMFTCATDTFPAEAHLKKTMESGRMINNPVMVEHMVNRAPSRVRNLIEMGLKGHFQETGFRCRTSGYLGGPHLSSVLVNACRKAEIEFLEHIMVTDLLVDGDECRGTVGFNKQNGKLVGFRSDAVLLATGGAGAIYAHTDNAPGATGDGYALMMEAGLELIDMEFVQFYPIAYAGTGRARMMLPLAFADLGPILNRLGEDVKEKYQIVDKPVAVVSRDRLSLALFKEVQMGNGLNGALHLDLRAIDFRSIPNGRAMENTFKKRLAFDKKPVPVAPTCHHTMGGVVTDEAGRTDLKGLFAAGEVTGGTHGANRMGGNAFCEALVMGEAAARSALEHCPNAQHTTGFKTLAKDAVEKKFRFVDVDTQSESTPAIGSLRKKLATIMWEKAGIVREGKSLREAVEEIDAVLESIELQKARSPRDLCKIIEFRNAALTGRAIAVSALKRTESRGSHWRDDFPYEVEDWLQHIHVQMMGGSPEIRRTEPISKREAKSNRH